MNAGVCPNVTHKKIESTILVFYDSSFFDNSITFITIPQDSDLSKIE